MMAEFRSLLLDRHRNGTAAQSLSALSMAAQGVRDQLSEDVWMVLADIERALAALDGQPARPRPAADRCERTGAVRAAGAGRHRNREHGARPGVVHARCRSRAGAGAAGAWRCCGSRSAGSAHPRSTARCSRRCLWRRSRSSPSGAAIADELGSRQLLELLVIDPFNPRSVAYQLQRIRIDLRAMPNTSPTARPLRLLDSLAERVRTSDPVALAESADGHRSELDDLLAGLHRQLRDLSDAIRDQYQRQPPTLQPLFRPDVVGGTA